MSSMTMSSSLEDPIITPVIKAFDHVTIMLEHNKKVYIEKRSRLHELMQRKTELEKAGPVPDPGPPPPQPNQQQQQLEQQPRSSPTHELSRTGSTGFYSTTQETPSSNIIHSPSASPSSNPSTPPQHAQPSSLPQNQGMPPPVATSTPRVEHPITYISSITNGTTNPSHLTITDETASRRNPYRAPSNLSQMRPVPPPRDTAIEESDHRFAYPYHAPSSLSQMRPVRPPRDIGPDPGATYIVPTPSGFTTPSQSGEESSPVKRSESTTGFPPQQTSSYTQTTTTRDPTQLSRAAQQHCGGGSTCTNGTTTGFQVLHCPDCNAKLGIVFEIFHMDGCPGNDGGGPASARTNN